MPDIAKVGLQADSSSLRVATKDMDGMSVAAKELKAAAAALSKSAADITSAFKGVNKSTLQAAVALKQQKIAVDSLETSTAKATQRVNSAIDAAYAKAKADLQAMQAAQALAREQADAARDAAVQAKLTQTTTKAVQEEASAMNEAANAARNASTRFAPTTKAFAGTDKTARELQFAMRGLPAQFTDIFTSLASGQRPMMVLLQQGGQLKDMFGGLRPALSAVGGAVMKMINPWTLAAAAIGALALAVIKGREELEALNKAVIQTNGYAGISARQLESMAVSMDSLDGVTRRSATDALSAAVATGKFSGAQVQTAARATLAMERMGAQAADAIKTISGFADDPVQALIKLQAATHRVDAADIQHVQTLIDLGKQQQAVTEALQIRARTAENAADEMHQHILTVAKAWGAVKDAFKEAFDFATLLGLKTADAVTPLQRVSKELDNLNAKYQKLVRSGATGSIVAETFSQLQQKSSLEAALQPFALDPDRQSQILSQYQRANQGLTQLRQGIRGALPEAQKLRTQIQQVQAQGKDIFDGFKAAGAIDQANAALAATNQRIAQLRKQLDSLNKSHNKPDLMAAPNIQIAKPSINGLDEFKANMKAGAAQDKNLNLVLGVTQPGYKNAMAKAADQELAQQLLDARRITQATADQFVKIREAARDSNKQISQFGIQAARNMQDAFANFLFDPFKDGVKGMVLNFAQALQKMAANMLASTIFDALKKPASGWINDLLGIGSQVVRAFAGAAATPEIPAGASINFGTGTASGLFAMPAFATGGIVPGSGGTDSVLARVSPGEGVFTPAQMARLAPAGHAFIINVAYNESPNKTPQQRKQDQDNFTRSLKEQIGQMARGAVVQDLADNGPVSRGYQAAFGLRRQGAAA